MQVACSYRIPFVVDDFVSDEALMKRCRVLPRGFHDCIHEGFHLAVTAHHRNKRRQGGYHDDETCVSNDVYKRDGWEAQYSGVVDGRQAITMIDPSKSLFQRYWPPYYI